MMGVLLYIYIFTHLFHNIHCFHLFHFFCIFFSSLDFIVALLFSCGFFCMGVALCQFIYLVESVSTKKQQQNNLVVEMIIWQNKSLFQQNNKLVFRKQKTIRPLLPYNRAVRITLGHVFFSIKFSIVVCV